MTQEDKLQSIYDTVSAINASIAVLIKQFEIVEERGCKASMDKIADTEERKIKPLADGLERNFREHTFIKGIAYTFGGLGALFGYIVHYFKRG